MKPRSKQPQRANIKNLYRNLKQKLQDYREVIYYQRAEILRLRNSIAPKENELDKLINRLRSCAERMKEQCEAEYLSISRAKEGVKA